METITHARRTPLDEALAVLSNEQKEMFDSFPMRLKTRFSNLMRSSIAPGEALTIVCNGESHSGIGGYWDTLLRSEADSEY